MAKCTMTPRKAARMARIARGHGPNTAKARRVHWYLDKRAAKLLANDHWHDYHPAITAGGGA